MFLWWSLCSWHQGKTTGATTEAQEGASWSSVIPHLWAPLWSPPTWKKKKDKRRRGVLPPSTVREVVASRCWSWLAVNGPQRPDWWRGPGVRRSASGSDKTTDCFSSPDYSNLDVQKKLAWQAGCCWSVCGGNDVQRFFSSLSSSEKIIYVMMCHICDKENNWKINLKVQES